MLITQTMTVMRCLEIILICNFITSLSCCPNSCRCTLTETDCARGSFTSIPSNIPLLTKSLVLSYNKIKTLQHSYDKDGSYLNGLNLLDLRHNQLSLLPELSFRNFPALKELYLDYNDIKVAPLSYPFDSISHHIKTISLSHNKLSGQVEEFHFFYSDSLTHLNLSHNSISAFHVESFPENLLTLDLSYNSIEASDSYLFGHLPALVYLDFCGQKFKHFRGEAFEELIVLQELKLGGVHLETVPDTLLFGLRALKSLSIVDSQVSTLPPSVLSPCTNLTKLDLSNNQLKTLSQYLFNSSFSLKTLNLERNKFSSLDDLVAALSLATLTDLNLSFNFLRGSVSSLVENQQRLLRLSLSNNLIQQLNEDIRSTVLEEIDLSYNRISFIKETAFLECLSIKTIDLTGNKLLSFPDIRLQQITQISIFVAQNTWNCTCSFYKSYAQKQSRHFRKPKTFRCSNGTDLSCLRCSYPAQFENVSVIHVEGDCVSSTSDTNGGYITAIYVSVALLFLLVVVIGCSVINKSYFARLIRKTGGASGAVTNRYNNGNRVGQANDSNSSKVAFTIESQTFSDGAQLNEHQTPNDSVYVQTFTFSNNENNHLNHVITNSPSAEKADENANSVHRKQDLLNEQQSRSYDTYPRSKDTILTPVSSLNNQSCSMKSLPEIKNHNV